MSKTGKTDWAAIDASTDEEIEARALSDPDNLPWTEEELANTPALPAIAFISHVTGLSAKQLSARYLIPLETIRDWEANRAEPDAVARAYLRAIRRDPGAVAAAPHGDRASDHPKAA